MTARRVFGPLAGNAFQAVMTGLEVPEGRPLDIFSESLSRAIAEHDRRHYGFPFTQVFEPGVLFEIALIERLDLDALATLQHCPTATTRWLSDAVATRAQLSMTELVNVASILVCAGRFALASELVSLGMHRQTSTREDFELAWLRFIISNRVDDGASSPEAFDRMRLAINSGDVPPARALDACTQAVVWFLKRREVPAEVFRWFAQYGAALTASGSDDLTVGGLSAWYRGVAMVPAATGRAASTRRYMTKALEAAEAAERTRPGADARNARKTYYESTMKEHLYVTGDLDAACDAGQALIDLDPVWSLSVGELAEVHERRGETARAAELYEQAVGLGPPSVGHHLQRAARCRVALGQHDLALEHYLALHSLDPRDPIIRREAAEVAAAVGGADLLAAVADQPAPAGDLE
jgi:tetratricopeptide (TPR) repeat protein